MPTPVLTIEQMRRWEQATWATGKSEQEVIEQVGACLARRVRELTRRGDRILILAGKGHNGDDARCARPHLTDREVVLVEVVDPATALAAVEGELSRQPALVVDGLFGIGLNRPLSESWVALITRVNQAGARVLAVDVPSGLDAEQGLPFGAAVEADLTLTLGAPKTGLLATAAAPFVGRLEVEPEIGLVPCSEHGVLEWVLPGDMRDWPPRRPVATHKGSYGHALLVAGSLGFHGAAVLAARGAQRARPGLITLLTGGRVYESVAAQLQAVMVRPTAGEVEYPENLTALLFGPGLVGPEAAGLLKSALVPAWRSLPVPVVVDASALDALNSRQAPPRDAIRVLTPHPGEAARMLRVTPAKVQQDRLGALRQLSAAHGDCWVVLKGHQTLIGRSEGPVRVNSSGNPGLAQGGSGDILAGYLTGLLAQPALQADPLRTLTAAVWRHGAAADRLAADRPNWISEELVEELARV
ncbi:MAG: NAD(P)H-hydrate dehydratase [Verrucomicrobiales bacterium]|nr:NAD(P)H-hydrate dehydratase [Verrucomicrobiales bacterium]